MTRFEAQSLILRTEGRLCVRYYQRKDGTIITNDCGFAERARRRVAGWAGVAAGICGLSFLIARLEPRNEKPPLVGALPVAAPDRATSTPEPVEMRLGEITSRRSP